ncbi:MAG: IclR family transcriptional regulator, acetate operon repressor [Solirubrobacteraceae bacterium]
MGSVHTALRVLEVVSERQPVGVSEVGRELGIPKSSAQRALVVLRDAGWLRPIDEGRATRWALTPRALIVGSRAGGEMRLTAVARPTMEHLHAETRESIHLLVREGDDMVLVEHLESPQPVRSSYPLGMRAPMSASSTGKAFLAALAPEEAAEVIAHGLRATTAATITDPQQLLEDLEETRARGYATSRGELSADISAVAAAILDARRRPVASMSISLPTQRMTDDRWDAYGHMVAAASRQVSEALGHVADPLGVAQ